MKKTLVVVFIPLSAALAFSITHADEGTAEDKIRKALISLILLRSEFVEELANNDGLTDEQMQAALSAPVLIKPPSDVLLPDLTLNPVAQAMFS